MANDKCEIQIDNFIKIGNSIGQVTVQTTYLLFLLMTLAKNCDLFCANVINEQLTDKKKLGHVKQTDICHYMVYGNIILNLSISRLLLHGKSYLWFQIKTRSVRSFDFEIMHMILDQSCTQFNFTIIYVPQFFITNFSFFTQITVPICHKRK